MTPITLRWPAALAALIVVFVIGGVLLFQTANAQAPGPAGAPVQAIVPRTPQVQNRPNLPQSVAITGDEFYLYIVQGNRLLRVNKSDLSIKDQTELRPPARAARPVGK